MTRAFGLLGESAAAGKDMTIQISQNQQGWAVAAWLVSNAAAFGISTVRYQGYQWSGFTGSGTWTAAPATTRPPGDPTAVEFG
jgi:hypothetical protein